MIWTWWARPGGSFLRDPLSHVAGDTHVNVAGRRRSATADADAGAGAEDGTQSNALCGRRGVLTSHGDILLFLLLPLCIESRVGLLPVLYKELNME